MARRRHRKPINLALQGGGAHGAFTWGVLDRLLEEQSLEIVAVTGASAGAMNAVVLADGLSNGDAAEARATLARFWQGVSRAAQSSVFQRAPWDVLTGGWSLDSSPGYLWFDMLSRLASPYDFNPLALNPLRDLVAELVDFERVRTCAIQVFIAATNVETGRAKVFSGGELTAEHVMASACLPYLFQAVEIDGATYWDGGFSGNPPLWPLFDHSPADDVLIVEINPITRPGAPRTARAIMNRMNEITFNAALLHELRAIDFVARLIEDGRLDGTGYRKVNVHIVTDADTLNALGAASRMNVEEAFLDMLFEKGRAAADGWLDKHLRDVGVRSSVDIRKLFQGEEDALDGARLKRPAAHTKRE